MELKEEIANIDTRPHPAETYIAPEADIATDAEHKNGNSYAALDWETEKSEGDLDGTNERDLWRCANPPIVQDEIASAENQVERDWIRLVGVVLTPTHFRMASWRGLSSPMSQCRPGEAEKAAPSSWLPPFLQHQPCVSGFCVTTVVEGLTVS